MLLHTKIYLPGEITKKLWNYTIKAFAEQLNELKVDDDGINPMGNFSGTTTYTTLQITTHRDVQFMSWMQY